MNPIDSLTPDSLPSFMQVTDLMEQAKKYLSEEALAALAIPSKSLTAKDEKDSYECLSLSVVTKVSLDRNGDNIDEAIQSIAKDLDALAEKGLIHSTISKVSSITLSITNLTLPQAVFAFVLVPDSRREEALNLVANYTPYNEIGKVLE